MRDRMKQKRLQNKKTLIEKIGIGFSVFIILIKGVLFFVTQQTTAFESATNFIKTNQEELHIFNWAFVPGLTSNEFPAILWTFFLI